MNKMKPTYSFKEMLTLLNSIDTLEGYDILFRTALDDMALYSESDAYALKVFLIAKRKLIKE